MTTGFARAACAAVQQIGPDLVRTLADGIERGLSAAALGTQSPVPGYLDAVRAVRSAQAEGGLSDPVAAAYLRGVADGYARRAAAERIESVWSGPSTHAVPVRSTAQALVEVVAGATDELLLMTYSARPHPPVIEALVAARKRGVRVAVVVETLQGAGGAIGGAEPAAAFLDVPGIEYWHWPPGGRTHPGAKMHAKIAVADRHALFVSSANITQSGVDTNIEAGVLVRGGTAPQRAAEHIEQLIAAGVLARLTVDGR
mgnify:CR=1 FL=1